MTGAPITLGRIARRMPRATLRLAAFHATLLRHSRGRADRWFGSRLLLLETVGRRRSWCCAGRSPEALSRIYQGSPVEPSPLPPQKDLPMRRLRTLSSRRLTAIVAAALVLAASAAIAQAGLIGADPKPEPKALDRAILDAANAPAVDGVSARISFTNGLLPSGSLPGGGASPLAAGADGRLWMAQDGRFRLELQSEAGDAQVASDGRTLAVYDASAKTVYRVALPDERPRKAERGPVTLAQVRRGLDRLARAWTLSGAKPTSTAGRPSYTVRIAPKDDGGLLGAGELAWDAVKGVPLRAAVYSQDSSEPVLELAATDISFGRVPDGDLRFSVPASTRTVDVEPPAGHSGAEHAEAGAAGVEAVQREVDFRLSAPRKLAGLPRQEVRLVRLGDAKAR